MTINRAASPRVSWTSLYDGSQQAFWWPGGGTGG
jgi:hypothetical protein